MASGMGWFKHYSNALHSQKILKLDDGPFRVLMALWCLGNESDDRGVLQEPDWDTIYRMSGARSGDAETCRLALTTGRRPLVIVRNDNSLELRDWEEWQGATDTTSTDRSKRYRNRLKDRHGASRVASRVASRDASRDENHARHATEVDLEVEVDLDKIKRKNNTPARKAPDASPESFKFARDLAGRRKSLGLPDRIFGKGFAKLVDPLIAQSGLTAPQLEAVAHSLAQTEKDRGISPQQVLQGKNPLATFESLADGPWGSNGAREEIPWVDRQK